LAADVQAGSAVDAQVALVAAVAVAAEPVVVALAAGKQLKTAKNTC